MANKAGYTLAVAAGSTRDVEIGCLAESVGIVSGGVVGSYFLGGAPGLLAFTGVLGTAVVATIPRNASTKNNRNEKSF